MKIGMLWFDNDAQRPLAEKVERAAKYYQTKYGATPNWCYASSRSIGESQVETVVRVSAIKQGQAPQPITLKSARTVLPNHFWLGVSEN